ncbi:MAG: YeeE/YedE family protein [Bauldia sp.]|nr:MAG: YeeE/YedE family protein [Bauldia sp.]MBZ0229388.1 YeeE/YedE family protein [Bauldia sp.]
MEHFTPLTATIGGALIGLAVTLLWVAVGRTAGVSMIAGAVLPLDRGNTLWRIAFLAGLPAGALLGALAEPLLFTESPASAPEINLSAVGLVGAGLFVGIGTRVGRGCTSGHGICGLARLSPRSFVAVATFMAAAMITVYIVRHVVS